MKTQYQKFIIRDWCSDDRIAVSRLIEGVLAEYNIAWLPETTDHDAIAVEQYYQATGGEFWVVEDQGKVVGTAAYYPCSRGEKAVEIRKMYLHPQARGRGLGKFLLGALEKAIADRGYTHIWIETASALKEAVQLYETQGYQPNPGVETPRCDKIYVKKLAISAPEKPSDP